MSEPRVIVDADVLGRHRTGDESYVANLLRELGRIAGDIRIAATTRDVSLLPPGIEPVPLPARSQAARMFLRLPALLARERPALAHLQYVIPPGLRVPAVVTVHDISYERSRAFAPWYDVAAMRALVPRSVRRAARVLTVSEWTKGEIVERYGVEAERVVVTPNGVDPAFRIAGHRPSGSPYLLFVGSIQPRKDPLAAVDALAALNGELRLVLAGPEAAGAAEVRARVAALGLEPRVEFRGYVGKDELASLYRGAECLVFPSRYEGFGLPVLEAMASGTPVVATATTSVPEVAGDAAILVPPGDAEALADGVRRALAARDELRAAGLARAASFTWAETARRTLAVYEELV